MPCPCNANKNSITLPTPPSVKPPSGIYGGKKVANWNPQQPIKTISQPNQTKSIDQSNETKPKEEPIFIFKNPIEEKVIPSEKQKPKVVVTIVNSDDPQLKEFALKNSIPLENTPIEPKKEEQQPKPQPQMNTLIKDPKKSFIQFKKEFLQSRETTLKPTLISKTKNKVSTKNLESNKALAIENFPTAQPNPVKTRTSITTKKVSTKNVQEMQQFFGIDPY